MIKEFIKRTIPFETADMNNYAFPRSAQEIMDRQNDDNKKGPRQWREPFFSSMDDCPRGYGFHACCSKRKRSASMAAWQPVPAAEIAWR
mgnify:CR=1 FL=1